jgi:DNA-binding NarL/FixJ family response regulator
VIHVLIVENEELVRQGLRRVLELDPELAVVGEARDGEEALRLVRESRPEVVLLDVRMPKLDGIGVLRALAADGQRFPPCLMLTTFDDPDALLDAVRAGAKGYLLKDVSFEQLTAAIRALAAGGTFIQPTVTEGLLRQLDGVRGSAAARPDSEGRPEPLTGRELEVLRLMAGGYSNREIARALFVAERTVKNHVSSILAKLYVRDRTRAVLKALDQRLI